MSQQVTVIVVEVGVSLPADFTTNPPPPNQLTVTTPGTAAIPATIPTDRDITVEMWGASGGGSSGGSTASFTANGGGGGGYCLFLVPRGIFVLGGTLTIGAAGTSGGNGGTTKITINSIDRVTITGGGRGMGGGTSGAAGVVSNDASITPIRTIQGVAGGFHTAFVSGGKGAPGQGPGAGDGGAGGTGTSAGSAGTALGGGGGGGGRKTGSSNTPGGVGQHGQARFTWS